MNKKLLILFTLLCLSFGLKAQTPLVAGDIAFTGFDATGNDALGDAFSFVLLKDISTNTKIMFSDIGYSNGSWGLYFSNESEIVWTATTSLSKGTEIKISGTTASIGIVQDLYGSTGLNLNNAGDQIFAYQSGTDMINDPANVFIAGINFNATPSGNSTSWNSDVAAAPSASQLPPSLVGGQYTFYTGYIPGTGTTSATSGRFNCTGAPYTDDTVLRTALQTATNWNLSLATIGLTNNNCPLYLNACVSPTIITQPVNQTACNSASFTVIANNALSYQWQVNTGSGFVNVVNGATYSGATIATLTIIGDISGMNSYQYRCLITGNGGCNVISNPAILTVSNLSISLTSQTNIACNGAATGSATVSPTGGAAPYTYSWSPSGGTGATASGLVAGTYTVTITDANACTATKTVIITQPTALTATTSQTNVSCNGAATGSATVTPTGGTAPYTYSWSPSGGTAATATGLIAGTYTVTITDANACTATKTVTITQPNALTATTSKTDVSCNGGANGTATVTPTGGTAPYTYSWSPSGGTVATATGLAAGTYTVTITDANACTITRSFTITQPTALTATTSQTNVSCNGGANGTARVTPTGGTAPYTYSWSPSGGTAATATGLVAGTYTVTVTDANGCTITRSFTITQPSAITTTASQTNVSCNGGANGTATVTATGGTGAGTYTYSWSPSGGTAATATGLAAGTYTVTITDANACTITRSFTITQPTALTATTSQTNVSCNGGSNGSARVTPTGGTAPYTYSWSLSGGTAATATGLVAGTYTVTITDANSCTITRSVTITQPSALTATITKTNACDGGANGSATVTATGGTGAYTYSWSPSGGTGATATGLIAGNYTVTVTDANNCQTTQNVTIENRVCVSEVELPVNKTYGVNNALDIVVEFNNAVTVNGVNNTGRLALGKGVSYAVVNAVTGIPRIALNIGGITRYADYISGSGTRTLTFRYIVQASDSDLDGIEIGNEIDENGATFTGATSISMKGSSAGILINGTLPVGLDKFTAKVEVAKVKLEWTTLSEQNNSYFIVERSIDGNNFIFLAKIAGNGTTTNKNNYSIYDNNAVNGVNYYRLKQVDNDGKESSIGLQIVNLSLSNLQEAVVYPNPTAEKINLLLKNITSGTINVTVVDVNSRVIHTENITTTAGVVNYSLNLARKLHAGTYSLFVKGKTINTVLKVVVK